jgi:hypothetical protein
MRRSSGVEWWGLTATRARELGARQCIPRYGSDANPGRAGKWISISSRHTAPGKVHGLTVPRDYFTGAPPGNRPGHSGLDSEAKAQE